MPPGMPPRANGGRAYASGGAVFEAGRHAGTQVQHSPGKNDGKDIGRGRVVTYKTGGAINASAKGGMGPKFGGGARGGTARLEKEARAKKTYAKAS